MFVLSVSTFVCALCCVCELFVHVYGWAGVCVCVQQLFQDLSSHQHTTEYHVPHLCNEIYIMPIMYTCDAQ